jgi:vacuolar-type H+-ATPase subunit I/STV1
MPKQSNSVDSFKTIIPPIVSWLGYGGLFPFVALAVAVWVDSSISSLWRGALLGYGAVILSFVGALHWGIAMSQSDMTAHQRTHCFVWSVVPALMAWIALLITTRHGVALMVVGFLIHFWQDWRLAKLVDMPDWYLPLRLRLTFVACAALLTSYFS